MKYIITFGNGQLWAFYVRPTTVSLVIEADSEEEARVKAMSVEGIGQRFCSSYPYETASDKFKKDYGMKEYTLKQLEDLRR